METMHAVVLTGHGGLDKLEYHEDWPKPAPGAGEVLIRVAACGLNNTDINTRIGWYAKGVEGGVSKTVALDGYPSTSASVAASVDNADGGWGGVISFPRIQGADVYGRVEAVGAGVHAELIDKRVMVDPWLLDSAAPLRFAGARYFGSEVNGGYADYTVVPAGNVHAVNSDYTDAELATFGCAYTTAENLLTRAALEADETVLVSGASGGVGSAAIQLAKIRGAKVVAISTADKAAALTALGADYVVDRHHPELAQAVKDAAQGEADVAVDVVGGDTFSLLIDCLRPGGRYAISGAIAGAVVRLDLRALYLNDLQLIGATVVPPGTFARLLRYIENKKLRPILARQFPLRAVAEAQRMFIDKKHVGNIVLVMDAS